MTPCSHGLGKLADRKVQRGLLSSVCGKPAIVLAAVKDAARRYAVPSGHP
jgi:hypothetical protein